MTTGSSRADLAQRLPGAVQASVADSVDVLHAAAVLESVGITDERSRTQFGRTDSFDLARALVDHEPDAIVSLRSDASGQRFRRSATIPAADDPSPLGNGLVYVALAVSIAALLQSMPVTQLAATVVAASSVGWVWAAVTAWLTYQREVVASAGRLARLSAAVLLLLTAAGGAVGVAGQLISVQAALTVLGLLGLQVGATLLLLARQRRVLLVALAPGAVGGTLTVIDRHPGGLTAGALFTVSVLAVVVAGFAVGGPAQASARVPRPLPLLGIPGLPLIVTYAVCSAAFLLIPQFVMLEGGGDLVLAMSGLLLVMGVVEWRAVALTDSARTLLSTVSESGDFRRAMAARSAGEVALILASATVVTLPLGIILERTGHLAPGAWLVLLNTGPLAAAYLLALAVANIAGYTWLCLLFGAAVLLEILLLGPAGVPVTSALLAATGLLLVGSATLFLTRPVHCFG